MERLTRGILYGLFFLLPLFFLPVVLDPLEIGKQTLLLIGVLLCSLLWLGSMIQKKAFQVRGGRWQLLPAMLLASSIVSAGLSEGRYLSFVGSSSQAYASVATLIGLVGLFYLSVNLLTSAPSQRRAGFWLVAAGAIVAWLGALPLYSVKIIPDSVAAFTAFNTVGTVNAFGIAVAALAVFACAMWMVPKEKKDMPFMVAAVALWSGALLALIAIDYWVVWLVFLAGLLTIFLFAFLRPTTVEHPLRYLPASLCAAVAILYLCFLPSPVASTLPVEVTLDVPASWQIAQQSLDETSWLFGAGPGTYPMRYAEDHTTDVNATHFWNTRFDRASSEVLTLLPTLGVVGTGLWALLFAYLLWRAGRIRQPPIPAIAFCVCLLVAAILYPSNMTLQFLLFAGAGLLGSAVADEKVWKLVKAKDVSLATYGGVGLVAVAITTVVFMSGQRLYAEAAFAEAVRGERVGADPSETVRLLDRAATFNRFDDAYERALAQALLARLGNEVQPDTQEITEGHQSFALAVATAAENAAHRATTQSPNEALNWLVRGTVSRALLPLVVNAGDDAIVSFQHAVDLEPNNPADKTELAKAYLAAADDAWRLASAEQDEAAQAKAQQAVDQLLANAEQTLNQAIALKPDYAPAHFQLALVYAQEGRLDDAIGKMESVAHYNPGDIGAAFQLGLLYMRRAGEGDPDRAEAQFTHAVLLAPSYSNAHWFLASIDEQKGDIPSAIREVQAVLSLNPGNDIVQARLDRLNAGTPDATIPDALAE